MLNPTRKITAKLQRYPVDREVFEHKVSYKDKEFEFVINPNTMDIFMMNTPEDIQEYTEYSKEKKDSMIMVGDFKPPRSRYLCIQPTLACNISCKYCFTQYYKDEGVKMMNFDTAKRAVDMFVPNNIQQGDTFSVGFFGGEPMCAFPIIRDITSYTAGKLAAQEYLKFHMTTNATLVSDEWLELFKRYYWTFIVSLDGPKDLHNSTRVDRQGKGTFEKVMEGLKRLSEVAKSLTLRGTFVPDPEGMNFLDRVKFSNDLVEQGYGDWVSVEPVQMSENQCLARPDAPEPFTEEATEKLGEEFLETAEWFVQEHLKGKRPKLHFFNKMLERFVWKQVATSECGAARGYFTCSPEGNLYACHRMNGTEIGDIWNGIDERKRCQWKENSIYNRPICMDCAWRYYCGGSCRQNSIFNMGDIRTPNPTSCRIMKKLYDANLYIMARMREEGSYHILKEVIRDPYFEKRQGDKNMSKKDGGCGKC